LLHDWLGNPQHNLSPITRLIKYLYHNLSLIMRLVKYFFLFFFFHMVYLKFIRCSIMLWLFTIYKWIFVVAVTIIVDKHNQILVFTVTVNYNAYMDYCRCGQSHTHVFPLLQMIILHIDIIAFTVNYIFYIIFYLISINSYDKHL
jgi:hypothetical protein